MSDAPLPPTSTALPGGWVPPPPPAPSTRPWQRAADEFLGAHAHDASARLLVGALAAGAVVAAVLVGHRPGLGVAVASVVLWAPALPALVRARAWSTLVTAALSVALASVAALRDADWVVAMALLAAAGVAVVAAAGARTAVGIGLALPTAPLAAVRGIRWVAAGLRAGLDGRRAEAVRWLRTAVVTLALVLVFGSLLASGDAIVASLVPRWDLGRLPGQVLVAAISATLAVAMASLAVDRPAWSTATVARPTPARRAEWFVPVLALVATLSAFLLVQVVAAVGGDGYVRATAGLTYAAYARQGFGQLVAVTALSLLVIAWFAARVPDAHGRQGRAARAALAGLAGLALGVVATALTRMSLYVSAYGLTELRILATAGEIGMGLVLLMVIVAVGAWRGAWLPVAVVRAGALVVLALAVANPDALMVRFNTQAQEVPLDAWHLGGLSADAVPAIDALEEPLRSCLLSAHEHPVDDSIWGWNLSRSLAAGADDIREQPDCTAVR